MNPEMHYSAVILASGLSERMGQSKALLMWDKKRTFLEKIIEEYMNAGCEKVVCTVNRQLLPYCKSFISIQNVIFVLNKHPEQGRMNSVRLGLQEVKNSRFCFIQNVDNPHVNVKIIRKILEAADPETWCSPEYKGHGGHPVLLSKIVIDAILQELNPDITLQQILHRFPKKAVEMVDDALLKNINTPEDYLEFMNRKM
jgi:CTP:molybdopterin cytidylyltransferase MocA